MQRSLYSATGLLVVASQALPCFPLSSFACLLRLFGSVWNDWNGLDGTDPTLALAALPALLQILL